MRSAVPLRMARSAHRSSQRRTCSGAAVMSIARSSSVTVTLRGRGVVYRRTCVSSLGAPWYSHSQRRICRRALLRFQRVDAASGCVFHLVSISMMWAALNRDGGREPASPRRALATCVVWSPGRVVGPSHEARRISANVTRAPAFLGLRVPVVLLRTGGLRARWRMICGCVCPCCLASLHRIVLPFRTWCPFGHAWTPGHVARRCVFAGFLMLCGH